MSLDEGVYFDRLFVEYSPLLTEKKRELFEMYFRLDLSLSEIAEINGVTRQSVLDGIASVKKQLSDYESKLGYLKKKNEVYALIDRLSDENASVGEQIKKVLGEG
ncbi:MAG: DNA-binding protein [Clostridia bacterium]|nr:DNA-binding protein [Clostridia bacterium]